MTNEQVKGLRLGMQVVRVGLDHAVQAIRDVQVMIDVFLAKLDDDKGDPLQ